jgi:hypothetical protein
MTKRLTDTSDTKWIALREPAYKGGKIYAYMLMFRDASGRYFSIPSASEIRYVSDGYK